MIADNQLALGVVLIIIGIAFGLLAYAVMLNRREAQHEEENMEQVESSAEESATEPEAEPKEDREEVETGLDAQEQVPAEEVQSSTRERRRRIPIATLARDEVTGQLIISMGEQDYRVASDITDEGDKRKLEYAAADLSLWFESKQDRVPVASAEEPAEPQQTDMIEEINEFLKQKLRHLPTEQQAVRLAEGASGGVRVYVGIDNYSLEDVPDENVKQLIREAVADWEAHR